MAAPAAEARSGIAGALDSLLRPEPTQLELCVRLGIICTLATLIVEIHRTPQAALAAYVVFFMNKADRVTSLIGNVALLLLLTSVVALVLGTALVALDDASWRVLAIALFAFAFTYLTSASKLGRIGPVLALVTGYALDLIGRSPSGEVATRALLYVCLFALIASASSVVVNLLFAPAPRRLAEHALARRLNVAADVLRAPDAGAAEALARGREGHAEVFKWLHLAAIEKTSDPEQLALLRQAAGATRSLFAALEVMLTRPEAMLPAPIREELARAFDELASALWRSDLPREVRLAPQMRAEPLPAPAAELLSDLQLLLPDFNQPRATPAPPAHGGTEPKGFFLPDAFTNPDHVRFALRTSGAALFCYLLYSLLDWPGIHTCFITVFIVSLGTVAESVEKLSLRMLGCLLGAAAGIGAIVFVTPALTSIGHLLIVVFLGTVLAGYIAAGSARVSYAGFQVAFAFYLCLLEGAGPSFDMVKARDRVLGVLLGNVVAYVALTSFWPVSIARRIDPAILRLLSALDDLSNAVDVAQRRVLAAKLDAGIAAVQTDLAIARYEPARLRPSSAWLVEREEALAAISALEAPLLLVRSGESGRDRLAARIEELRGRFAEQAPPAEPNALPVRTATVARV